MFSSPKKTISILVLFTFLISNTVFAFGFLIPLATNFVRNAVIASAASSKAYKVGSKIFIPLATRRPASNKRGLQILVAGLGLTFGASLAQFMGFLSTTSTITTGYCSGTYISPINFVTQSSCFSSLKSSTPSYVSNPTNYRWVGNQLLFDWAQGFNTSLGTWVLGSSQTITTSPTDNLLNSLSDPNAPQSLTDDLLFAVKQSTSHPDFNAAVSLQDIANYQLPSDYFSGDSLAVDHLGDLTLNGVPLTGNVGTFTGQDGLTHHMTINSNGDLLVDGQLSTGFTASNFSTGSSTSTATTNSAGVTTTNATTTIDNTGVITGLRAVQSSVDASRIANATALNSIDSKISNISTTVNTAGDTEVRPMTLTGLTTAAQSVVDTSPLNSWAGALNVTGGSPVLPSYDVDLFEYGIFKVDFNSYTWFFDILSLVIVISAAGFAVSIVFRR